jgi:hypothetical protein
LVRYFLLDPSHRYLSLFLLDPSSLLSLLPLSGLSSQ